MDIFEILKFAKIIKFDIEVDKYEKCVYQKIEGFERKIYWDIEIFLEIFTPQGWDNCVFRFLKNIKENGCRPVFFFDGDSVIRKFNVFYFGDEGNFHLFDISVDKIKKIDADNLFSFEKE